MDHSYCLALLRGFDFLLDTRTGILLYWRRRLPLFPRHLRLVLRTANTESPGGFRRSPNNHRLTKVDRAATKPNWMNWLHIRWLFHTESS
jgi:hypothetical protein